jgi:hypothetical protein
MPKARRKKKEIKARKIKAGKLLMLIIEEALGSPVFGSVSNLLNQAVKKR